MKKTFIAIACACMVALGSTACDPESLVEGVVEDIKSDLNDAFGSVALKVSNAQGVSPYAQQDSMKFSACVTGIVSDTITIGEDIEDFDGFKGFNTFIMGANISLSDTNEIDISNVYPIFGIKTKDTLSGVKEIHNPMGDTNILMNFNFGRLITEGSEENLFGIAMSEESWYVGAAGQFNIDQYPDAGRLMKATMRNVKAYYVTQADLDSIDHLFNRIKAAQPYASQYADLLAMEEDARNVALAQMTEAERTAFQNAVEVINDAKAAKDDLDVLVANPDTMFPSIVLNGKIEARRTDVQGFIDQLNVEE